MDVLLPAFVVEFRRYKALADGAFAQVADAQLVAKLSPTQNSLFVIAQHVAGNLRSRFTDFLTTDGEKPDRDRDGEFVEPAGPVTREAFVARWEAGWRVLFATLDGLSDADLTRTVTIRGEPMTVAAALSRSVAHVAYHVGQVALLAKHLRGEGWSYLTIPPAASPGTPGEGVREFPAAPVRRRSAAVPDRGCAR